MSFKEINCPSCGASLQLKYRFSEMVVCGYCDQTSHLVNSTWQAKGDKVKLSDYGSLFFVGAEGSVKDQKFKVLGRLRYQYPDGFWDEWLLQFEQSPEIEHWLQEDEGDYTLFVKSDILPEIHDFDTLKVGEKYPLGNKKLFISEKNTAQIVGGEGELPFRVIPGEQANYVDGIIVGEGVQTSLEFMPNKTEFYIAKHTLQLPEFTIANTQDANLYG